MKSKQEKITLREYVDVRLKAERSVIDELHAAQRRALKVRAAYIEKRLSDLNGEASRIQTVLASTVQRGIFDSYVTSERERSEATAKAQRERFDAYASAQAAAMKAYTDEMARWRSAVSIQMARWGGGLAVLLVAMGVWLKYGPT